MADHKLEILKAWCVDIDEGEGDVGDPHKIHQLVHQGCFSLGEEMTDEIMMSILNRNAPASGLNPGFGLIVIPHWEKDVCYSFLVFIRGETLPPVVECGDQQFSC
jgi:hypothetical protein